MQKIHTDEVDMIKGIMQLGILSMSMVMATLLSAADVGMPAITALPEEQQALGQELIEVSFEGNAERVQEMFLQHPFLLHTQDTCGNTALMMAAARGHTIIVEKLLIAGVKVDLQTGFGWTALMRAASMGRNEIVEMLLLAGADADAQNNSGWTALMWAAVAGHVTVVTTLLEYKGALHIKNKDDKTALDIARENAHTPVVDLLEWHAAIVPEEEDTMVKPAVSEQALVVTE